MMMPIISCPYCNAHVPRPDSMPGARVLCPRCGEMFPYRLTEGVDDSPRFADPARNEIEGLGSAGPGVSNKAVAAAVLGVMLVMAVAGLIFALQTETLRRAHDANLG